MEMYFHIKMGVKMKNNEIEKFKSRFFKGVVLTNQFENNIVYSCSCDCGSPEHDVIIDFEFDPQYQGAFLNFYKDIYFFDKPRIDLLWFDHAISDYFNNKNKTELVRIIFENIISKRLEIFWNRFKNATRLLFTGYLKMNEDFILREGEHLDNLILALIEGRDFLESKNKE